MPQSRVQANAAQFDRLAPRYDALGFLTAAAQALAQQVELSPSARVLDIATGTGTVALALAGRAGAVVGVDVAPAMLDVARRRAAGNPALSFRQAEATALPFESGTFDTVTCGAGLFFVPDMVAALQEWGRVLRPGGEVVFSAFGRGLLGPLPGLWRERLAAAGVKPGAPPLGRIGTAEAAQELLKQAEFEEVFAELTVLDYRLPNAEARWADIAAGLEGLPLRDFAPHQQERLQLEHLTDLEPLFAAGPLTVPIPLIVARGRRV